MSGSRLRLLGGLLVLSCTGVLSDGALPPALMNEAMSTESWYTEHRAALDFHAKMAKTQMGGSLQAPSIAQLLDQNLVTPQQATASQNLGELVPS